MHLKSRWTFSPCSWCWKTVHLHLRLVTKLQSTLKYQTWARGWEQVLWLWSAWSMCLIHFKHNMHCWATKYNFQSGCWTGPDGYFNIEKNYLQRNVSQVWCKGVHTAAGCRSVWKMCSILNKIVSLTFYQHIWWFRNLWRFIWKSWLILFNIA